MHFIERSLPGSCSKLLGSRSAAGSSAIRAAQSRSGAARRPKATASRTPAAMRCCWPGSKTTRRHSVPAAKRCRALLSLPAWRRFRRAGGGARAGAATPAAAARLVAVSPAGADTATVPPPGPCPDRATRSSASCWPAQWAAGAAVQNCPARIPAAPPPAPPTSSAS